ncbi:uncharacterized protein LOC144580656 [Callithrix jacchus]
MELFAGTRPPPTRREPAVLPPWEKQWSGVGRRLVKQLCLKLTSGDSQYVPGRSIAQVQGAGTARGSCVTQAVVTAASPGHLPHRWGPNAGRPGGGGLGAPSPSSGWKPGGWGRLELLPNLERGSGRARGRAPAGARAPGATPAAIARLTPTTPENRNNPACASPPALTESRLAPGTEPRLFFNPPEKETEKTEAKPCARGPLWAWMAGPRAELPGGARTPGPPAFRPSALGPPEPGTPGPGTRGGGWARLSQLLLLCFETCAHIVHALEWLTSVSSRNDPLRP